MSLIRVQCETCQATLRVRDEGFVGEVHACPRCGSMVLIGGGPSAEAATPQPAEASANTTLVLSNTLETVEVPVTPGSTPPAGEAAPVEIVDTPPGAATSWGPLVTTVVSLMATGAILTVWMLSGTPEAENPHKSIASVDSPAVVVPEVIEPEPPTTAGASAVAQDPPGVDSQTRVPIEALAESLPPEPPPKKPPTPRVALVDPPRESPLTEPSVSHPPREIDPLLFDPSEAVVILRRGTPDEPNLDPLPTEPRPSEPTPRTETPPTLDQRLAAAAQQAGVSVRLGPTDADSAPFAGSADAALTQVVPAVDLRDIPLDEAVRLLGRIAGVPVTIDPAALRYAGVAAGQPIEVAGEDQSVATLLTGALKPVRLSLETNGPHVTVMRKGIDAEREVTHRLRDLIGDDPQALVEDLLRIVACDGPFDLSADGSLTFTASMATHYDLRITCERLRLARGLDRQSKYPTALLPIDSSLTQLEPILGRRATFSFVTPTPLDEVFDYWRRATGLTILIDWRSLADVGLGPRSTVACSVTNRTWRDGLSGVLGSLGLAWTARDGGTLWVSTEEALGDRPTIEFLAVPREGAEALRADLLDSHPTAAVAYDAPSGRLLIRCNASLHAAVRALSR